MEIPLDNSSPSVLLDADFVNALKGNLEALNFLSTGIREEALKSGLQNIKLSQILKDGVLANCTLQYLRDNPEFADITFPDGNVNILLVNRLELEKTPLYGRVINSNGQEVFVIKGTKNDVMHLANYLNIRNAIRESPISDQSPYYKNLMAILDLRKEVVKNKDQKPIETIEDMLLDYISNENNYTSIYIGSNKSKQNAKSILETYLRHLKNYNISTIYRDPFVNTINTLKQYIGNGQISIKSKELYEALYAHHSKLLKIFNINNINNITEFKEVFKSSFNEEFYNKLKKEITKYLNFEDSQLDQLLSTPKLKNTGDAILRIALATEPDFTYLYESINKYNLIILKQQYIPISEKYDISYETILKMSIEKYKGYTIYTKQGGQCFISRGSLVENSASAMYSSEDGAKQAIDQQLSRQGVAKNSFIEFKFRETHKDALGNRTWVESLPSEIILSSTNFLPGQIIDSLNIPIDKNTRIRVDEEPFTNTTGSTLTLKDFENLIRNTWAISEELKNAIINSINTPEKVTTFIYKINELIGMENRSEALEGSIKNIVDLIKKAKYNYYYIESKKLPSKKTNKFTYKIIPIKDKNILEEYTSHNSRGPIIMWMLAISEVLLLQFGVTINLKTSEEINEEFKNIADPNIDKAFIYNGEIYVNTSIASTNDLLHEHVHLILRMLKSNPDLRQNYEKLLNLVLSTSEGTWMAQNLKERYSNLSSMDLAEEVFAKLFSNYIRGNISLETRLIFAANSNKVKAATESIFNTKINNLEAFFGTKLTTIFSKFNSSIADLLNSGNSINFGEQTIQARKISNYINQLISKQEIKENCK